MRKRRVKLNAFARADLLKAIRHYRKIDPLLVARFNQSLFEARKSLEEFSAYEIKSYGLRTYNLKQFPYCLYFNIIED